MFDVSSINIDVCDNCKELYPPEMPLCTIWDIIARCNTDIFNILLEDFEQQYGKNLTSEQIGSYI
jgi:hypothetical protein